MEMKLSAVIIAKDEEKMITDCLKSVSFADEILLIDTGCTDSTVRISKKYGARVVRYTTGRFSDWRNRGLKEARGEWILYVDADERIPKALSEEILRIVKKGSSAAYAIPRKNIMFGKEMKHIGVPPDYQKRFFKKDVLFGWKGDVHEEPILKGELFHLKNAMIHDKHESFAEMVEKTNFWSGIEAKLMYDAGHPSMNIPRFITAMSREFYLRMIVHKAFLDGKIGIMYAIYQVFSRFVSYAKLWEMQINYKKS